MDFDPHVVSYAALLERFFEDHNATRAAYSRQYMSAIYTTDSEQQRAAEAARDRESARRGRKVVTEIVPLRELTIAEDYHQKYGLRHDAVLLADLATVVKSDEALRESPVAARLNGYVQGCGSFEQLESEIDSFGLGEHARERLRRIARAG